MMKRLAGKKGLVIGIANQSSIAWGCAKIFHQQGAELAITYLNEKASSFVKPLADQIGASLFLPLDVRFESQIVDLFQILKNKWGKLDFLVHSIAFAPREDLWGRVLDCSKEGFLTAMDISCHSFIRLSHYAASLMSEGGSLLTVSYYGAEKVVEHYSLMGPVKAALEASVQYLAFELGSQKIRVNALSPGPILTRAAGGLAHFDQLLLKAKIHAPEKEDVTIEDVGEFAAFLVSDAARHITGNIAFIDAGLHIMAP